MALNKYAAIRYRIIDECIRSRTRPYPTKEELRSRCEEALYGTTDGNRISMSTIEKDIWALKNEQVFGYAPIAFSRIRNGYYYTDPSFSLDLPVTPEDVDLIRLALHTLNHFRDSRLFSDLETAVGKIRDRILLADRLNSPNLENVIRFENAPAGQGREKLPFLLDAVRDRQEVRFTYTPYVDGRERKFVYHPYLLQENKNRWYLVGKDQENSRIRTLGVDRIEELSLTGRTFPPDPEFDPEQLFRHSFGIGTYSGIPEEIVFLLDEVQTRYIRSNPLHPSQEIIEKDSGNHEVRLFVIPSDELKMQILSYGSRAEVLKPGWLRDEISEILGMALRRYRNNQ